MICRDTPTHGWVCGWLGGSLVQWVGLGQMNNNRDNSILFEDLSFVETPHPWVGVWVVGWVTGSMGGVKSND